MPILWTFTPSEAQQEEQWASGDACIVSRPGANSHACCHRDRPSFVLCHLSSSGMLIRCAATRAAAARALAGVAASRLAAPGRPRGGGRVASDPSH